MEHEEKELVWLPKSLAAKVEALKDSDNFVEEYIEQSKREINTNLESFDNEIISYKANMIKARKEFQIAKDEMIQANYEMWEKFDEERKSTYNLAEKMVETLKPLKDELVEIQKLMDGIHKWRIEDLLKMLKEINGCAPEGSKTRDMLVFLMENFKNESR